MGRVTLDALRNYYPNERPGRRLQPLPKHNAIYVRNAKVGTGTTLLWLHRVHTEDHEFNPKRGIHAENQLPRPEDVGWDTVVHMLNGAAFRFCFVRDPIRRLESAFLNKVVLDPARSRRRLVRRIAQMQTVLGLPRDPDQDLSFDQFISALELQEPLLMDTHWRPQHLNLMHPLVEYDLIGRLETYDTDLARVQEATGMPNVPVEVWKNTSHRPEGGLFDGRPSLLRRAQDLYATDFELYGY